LPITAAATASKVAPSIGELICMIVLLADKRVPVGRDDP
jgi:hypothetical protein